MKRSKKSNAVATPTTPTKAGELPAVPEPKADAKKPPAPAAEKPIRFAKGTRVRYRTWDKAEGPLDREGTVTGHGPKWISINRVVTYADGKTPPKVVPDWSVLGQCEAIGAEAS